MNIYEQLNKINDKESLSEKYNVKNAKELRKLKESISSINIPAPWNKYLEVDDYTPEEGEYIVGDKIGEYTLVAYLVPKAEYEDMIDEWPMLFKNSDGYIVGTTSHDRVYPYDVEDFGLEESLKEAETSEDNKFVLTYRDLKTSKDLWFLQSDGSWTKDLTKADVRGMSHFDSDKNSIVSSAEKTFNKTAKELLDTNLRIYSLKQVKPHSLKEAEESTPYQRLQKVMNNMRDSNPRTMDAAARAIDSKKLVEAAKQIIDDLKSRGFDNSDIASIGSMIKETTDSRHSGDVSNRDRLKKAFPDFAI